MKKYRLTNNTLVIDGVTVYQIQSLQNFADVKINDLGGYVAHDNLLPHEGNVWLYEGTVVLPDVKIHPTSFIGRYVIIQTNASIGKNTFIDNGVRIGKYTVLDQNVRIDIGANIGEQVFVGKNTHIKKFASISKNASIHCNVTIGSFVYVDKGVYINKNVCINDGVIWVTSDIYK